MSTNERISVRCVMKANYTEMDGIMTVKDAISAMLRDDSHTLIINKRDEHDEYGLVGLGDIAKKVLAKDRSPERVNLYEIMSKPILSISPDMDIRYAARMFNQFGLSCCPVQENGKVIGLVTYEAIVLHGLS